MAARSIDTRLSRRRFVQVVSLGTAGFAVGCSDTQPPSATPPAAAPEPATLSDLNTFIRIGSDNAITVIVKHLDKGQGTTTGLAAIVAEELGAEWVQMRTEFAPADASRYNNLFFGPTQGTGGSTSIANSWMQLRNAAAAAREMLRAAAAERWQVDSAATRVERGQVIAGDKIATFGELAAAASKITPPAEPTLKDPSEFTLLGTHLPRLDSAAKTDGSQQFTMDLSRPGMRIAVVARPPRFGGRATNVDASAALAVPGVEEVVEIPRGIAVLADSFHSATKGRQALVIEWDDSTAEMRGTEQIRRDFRAFLDKPGIVTRNEGDTSVAVADAATTLTTDFEFPFLAHTTMEPLDCIAEVTADGVELWTGSQLQTVDQAVAAAIAGVDPAKVTIHTQYAGGSFGRRATPDADVVGEAVSIAMAQTDKRPVKVIWSREDDVTGGRYRPMAIHRITGSLAADGTITGWDQRIVSQSIAKGTPFEAMMENGIDPSAVEGARELPYAIPNLRVDLHLADTGVPVLWWRSVGHTHTAYATEVFLDQLAREAGQDPLELRRRLLEGQPRFLAVLNKAAEAAGWGESLEAGRGRGIALHKSFNSFVAQVADVTISESGELTVDRVVCAVDCGFALTPDVVKAQMEGGIGYGLSAALREAVTMTDGVVDQKNFDTYRPLRIHEMPDIDVQIVNSGEAPTGVGEPGTPPVAPALANAIAAATGQVVTALPIATQVRDG
ncbi:MAG: xanthine dehydrogenase family protein molybdopterin-binding subunit [Pseudomonadota bacterium]